MGFQGSIHFCTRFVVVVVQIVCMCVQLLRLCPSLCDPMDCSPPGSSLHEILQARILEWLKSGGTGWGGRCEGVSGWSGQMYTYGQFILMHGKNHHNIVK